MYITGFLHIIQSRLNFEQIFKIFSYIYYISRKFFPVVADSSHADRKMDRQTWRSWQSIFADIRIIAVFCLSVTIQTVTIPTRHAASSIHNILLQFPHHTALKATNPSANHTLLDRLIRYILCTFLFQYTSCVMLSISSCKHPYINLSTWTDPNQFHYQWSHCKAEHQIRLNNYNIYCYLTVGDNNHCTEHNRKLHVQWHGLLKCDRL